MNQQSPVMRICISCRKKYDRDNLIKITKDHKQGVIFKKGWGVRLTFASQKCYSDSKIKKKLQKVKTLEPEFFDIFKKEIATYNDFHD